MSFDKSSWEEMTKDVDYSEVRPEPKRSEPDINIPDMPKPLPTGIGYILIVVIVLLLIFLIVRFMLSRYTGSGKLKKEKITINVEKEEEIEPSYLEEELSRAISEGNYREALRYRYLILIAKLASLEWIIWKKDKTNRSYLNEMRLKANHYKEFSNLTLVFEEVWYGDRGIDSGLFNRFSQRYDDFHQQIDQK
jgi:hypothetical protein